MEKQSIFAHMIGIIESIEADLMLPLKAHEREDRGGFFSISRQVFSYIDYLGALASNGENSTKNAVAYMEKYFSLTNASYKGRCHLMYAMWRHGTVHEYDPKVFKSETHGFQLYWGANNTSPAENRKWHLKCLCRANQPYKYHWFINLFELVDDLRKSVISFVKDLEDDSAYFQKAKHNLNSLSSEVDLDKSKSPLLEEANAVISTVAGVIDDRGNVIRQFKDASEFEAFKNKEWGTLPSSA